MEPLSESIRRKIREGNYRFSHHAVQRCFEQGIVIEDVVEGVTRGCEVIENYPDDPRGHSCLVLTFTKDDRPLHVVIGVSDPSLIIIITVYEPDPRRWENFRIRRG